MPSSAAQQNIWKQMNYTPPRGPCNHKESLLSPKCPCLRFMLHPLKLTSSFTCDGCNHHASFHSMSSPTDDAILARWESTADNTTTTSSAPAPAAAPRSRKRPRRALLEARPTTANAGGGDGGSVFDGHGDAPLFSEDVEFGIEPVEGRRRNADGSKTWGDRFSSWSFGRAEEPVKTPPKRQQGQQQRPRRREQEGEVEVRSDVVDLD